MQIVRRQQLGIVQETEQFIEGLGTTVGTTAGNVVAGFGSALLQPLEGPALVAMLLVTLIVLGPELLKK
jgi:hypothetical protein